MHDDADLAHAAARNQLDDAKRQGELFWILAIQVTIGTCHYVRLWLSLRRLGDSLLQFFEGDNLAVPIDRASRADRDDNLSRRLARVLAAKPQQERGDGKANKSTHAAPSS
jgi:hypothetical protein